MNFSCRTFRNGAMRHHDRGAKWRAAATTATMPTLISQDQQGVEPGHGWCAPGARPFAAGYSAGPKIINPHSAEGIRLMHQGRPDAPGGVQRRAVVRQCVR